MTTEPITTAEVQQIRQRAIFNGPLSSDEVKRLAQSWLDQHHELDVMTSAAKATLDANKAAEDALARIHQIHAPLDAVHEQTGQHRQVCTGCGTDAGNWQIYPCPTIRAINHAPVVRSEGGDQS